MLEFINSSIDISTALPIGYNPRIVLLSYIIACVAAYAAWNMTERLQASREPGLQYMWLGAGAAVLGFGIWCMHFVGMLAMVLPIPVAYDLATTLLSVVPAVLVAAFIIRYLSQNSFSLLRILLAGTVMGAGIGTMHYVGMMGMRLQASMYYSPLMFALSLVVAVVLAVLCLFVGLVQVKGERVATGIRKVVSVMTMGAAITGMHYTAMSAVYFFSIETTDPVSASVLDPNTFSIFIALVTLVLFGLALVSTRVVFTMEQELQRSDEKFQQIFRTSLTPMVLLSRNPVKVIEYNNAIVKLLGYEAHEIKLLTSDVVLVDTKEFARFRKELIANGVCDAVETQVMAKGNRIIPVLASACMVKVDGEQCILAQCYDMSEQKANERKLQEAALRLQRAQSIAFIGDFVLDLPAGVLTGSPECFRIMGIPGRSEISLEHWDALVHPEDRALFESLGKEDYNIEFRLSDSSHGVEIVNSIGLYEKDKAGNVNRVVGTIQDITERKQFEAKQEQLRKQLLQAQKMESLGVLAGGIAHDFNNLLTGILGNAELAKFSIHDPEKMHTRLENIMEASKRAAELTNQLLAYSGKGKFVIGPINLSDQVKEIGELLLASIGKNARLEYSLDPNLPIIEGDQSQIQQIVMNLIINGAEALESKPGIIKVSTGVMDVEQVQKLSIVEIAPGPEPLVYLQVEDNGVGMDRETTERLFDPFFTTKFTGRGLGMAAVLGIVRGHRGGIAVDSTPGSGSRFTILFPSSDLELKLSDPKMAVDHKRWYGQERVLVIDDEEMVRNLLSDTLTTYGYSVLLAAEGQKGIDLYRQHQEEIQLVLVDLTMPNLDGKATVQKLRKTNDDVKVLLMSGYSEEEAMNEFTSLSVTGFISKPFKHDELMDKVSGALAQR